MLSRQHKVLNPGRIIAELNFGFWSSMLDKCYEQVLWPQLIKTAFPYMPRKIRTRKVLSQQFHKIRQLRNRIFHHEPIWY
ncbi:Abi family protein [endosymbiont of Lamellibrachia barhami]|uniref:Abi family protein n=1 Tax=endosymbiont of Lamellibrachia barhami TaxID=205975 RepID=UPI0015B35932|nr:Abi family protein [endosymbiont of Lamellibrachia barhami]